MLSGITVTELFRSAGLKARGPVCWCAPVTEEKPGVYVVAIVGRSAGGCGRRNVAYLKTDLAKRWVQLQAVIYIGRTKRPLSRRIREFYRHVHGMRSPHKGGEDVKLLTCKLWVYWSPTEHCARAEDKMIEKFRAKVRRLPFANRLRSARVRNIPN